MILELILILSKMAISDYLKKYFEPTPEVRLRDVVREIPSGIKHVGGSILEGFKESGQSFFRGTAGVASTLTGKTLTPSTYFQKELYGTDKPITAASFGAELGFKEEGIVAPVVGFALGAADLIPGGQTTKRGAVTLLKNADNADDAFRILTKVMGVAREVAEKYLDDAVRLTDEKQLAMLVDKVVDESQQVSRFVQKGKEILTGTTRRFVESAKEVIPQANKIAGQYIPRSTDTLAIKAKNLIRETPQIAERIALTESNDNAVAIASELLKKYADDAAKATDPSTVNAIYDKAAEVANTLAPKLTEQGRAIQAASILGRLTPEGQVRFAAREIQRFNETVPLAKRIPELTGEQAKYITEEMKVINAMADGTEKAVRFQKLQNYVQDLIPTPVMNKVIAVWKAGLLTGIKTQGLNIFSNLFHGTSEIVKDVPAAIVDSVASLFTGQRTKAFTTKGLGTGAKEGFDKGLRYFKTGFDERNIGAKFDYTRVNFGKGIVAKAFQAYTDTVFRFIGAQDQPFYYGALSRSLMDQALAQGMNVGKKGKELVQFAEDLVQNPTEEMIRYAVADATISVFQNKTKLGEAARAIQKIPVAGQVVLPFGRTPSAVAMQIINYSPIGIAKTIIENIGKGKFDQRLFSQGMGRGLTGTAILSIGYELAKKGLISLDSPIVNEREQELQKAEGKKANAIKVDGKWRSPTVLGPAGNLLLIGGQIQNALQTSGSATEAMTKTVLGASKAFTEQTFLTGLKDAVNAVTDPARYAKSYLPNLIASFVPTAISDISRAVDPLERRTETMAQRVQARIPFARQGLEPQVDILGRQRESVGNPLEILADPTRPSEERGTPVTTELRRLTDAGFKIAPTLLGDKAGYKGLSQEENTRLWELAGGIINDKLTSLFSKEEYLKLSDDEKGNVVEKIIDKAKINARTGMVIELTDGLEGEELKAKLSELKAGGLLTREVLSKYHKLR